MEAKQQNKKVTKRLLTLTNLRCAMHYRMMICESTLEPSFDGPSLAPAKFGWGRVWLRPSFPYCKHFL